MTKLGQITVKNIGNSIFIPAVWIVDERGGLRLALEAEREPVVFVARPSIARQNGHKRMGHASRPSKGVAVHSTHAAISKGA